MSSQPCQRCQTRTARGGHRYCYRCLGELASESLRQAAERPESTYTYPPRDKKSRATCTKDSP